MFGQGMPFHTIQEQLILQNKLLAALIGVVAAPRNKVDGSAVISRELADKIQEISNQMKGKDNEPKDSRSVGHHQHHSSDHCSHDANARTAGRNKR